MKECIKQLLAELELHARKVQQIDAAIKALQKVCNHKDTNGQTTIVEIGHDGHYSHYRCSICGYFEKR